MWKIMVITGVIVLIALGSFGLLFCKIGESMTNIHRCGYRERDY